MADPATLARLAAAHAYGDIADGELLERFAGDRDDAAFAALIERHGAVVIDAAQAVLRHDQDAEDVFQATFLVLARKAATIRKRESLACWLHGVARRIALRALRTRTRRERHEGVPRDRAVTMDELTWGEIRSIVHEELARLPEALRAPVLLCHLEGVTLDEAAHRLRLTRGTLRGRLDRARGTLRLRFARRGLAVSALVLPGAAASAIPPLVVVRTARLAARFAAGVAETTRATELANGAMSMTATRLKYCLLLVIAVGGIGLGFAVAQNPDVPPKAAVMPEPRDAEGPAAPAAQPPAVAKAEFEEVTIAIKPGFLNNRSPETITITENGTCLYKVPERPVRGDIPAWTAAAITHKLPPERLRELGTLLKGTDWLATDAKEVPQMHHPEYGITLKRGGKTAQITLKGESKPYKQLLHFFESIAAQEYLLYRLEWVPAAMGEGRRDLDGLIGAELGEPSTRSPYSIDLTRYTPWATRQVRNPFEKQADDVRTAIRLVGLLNLESEREYLADLASDRDRNVRTAVVQAVARLGGEKAVPVLRKLARSTGEEAAWELIKLGPVAVPTIIEAIRDGVGEEDLTFEWLIRAYIDHWKDVRKPLDAKIVEAVRTSMANPKVKAHRISYHVEFLKLVSGSGKKE